MKKRRYVVLAVDILSLPVHLMVIAGSNPFSFGGNGDEGEEEEDPNGARRHVIFDEDYEME